LWTLNRFITNMLKHYNPLFSPDVLKLEKSFLELSKILNKLPIGDSFKKPYLEKSLKEKSAWYACLVNSNIDILLLPEYLENKQTRNILLKKETEQYLKSFDLFSSLSSKNNQEVFESILFADEVQAQVSFDLFSSQIIKTESCPQYLIDLFIEWQNCDSSSELESLIYQFVVWHETNQFSFSNHRQLILWLNFKLWRLFGSVVFKLNIERYFYHHWNKESRDTKQSIKDFISFLFQAIEDSKIELRDLYRQHIQYEQLKPSQKMASNYLFSNAFESGLPNTFIQQITLNKTLLKKGFVALEDMKNTLDAEKLTPLLQQLIELGRVSLFQEFGEITICLTPTQTSKSNLSKYSNIALPEKVFSLKDFINQEIKVEEPKEIQILPIQPIQMPESVERRKVFFG
jgi:hypothetical protein